MAVELLRRVALADNAAVNAHGGRVVKRLGDGLMAAFDTPAEAVAAAWEAQEALSTIEVSGHRPQQRAGVHFGRPRRIGGDYFGVDVNIAARMAAAAAGGEVLVSEAARAEAESDDVEYVRRWRFRAKGTPQGLKVFAARPGKEH